MKKKPNILKGIFLTILFIVCILILAYSVIQKNEQNIIGKAFYEPVRVYGKLIPALPDGVEIKFVTGEIELASGFIVNNKYGYEEDMFFEMDNSLTDEKEGYAKGDVVIVYLEGVNVAEMSYFVTGENEKDLQIPIPKRIEVADKAAESAIKRGCIPSWQCGDWSKCVDGVKQRTCVDILACGKEGKPAESEKCVVGQKPMAIFGKGILWLMFIIAILIGIKIAIKKSLFFKNNIKNTRKIK